MSDSCEQQARNLLERLTGATHYADPQRLSAGDVVELAQMLAQIERLQIDNHHLRGLLETAVDAWECGQAVTNREGVVLADFRGACLPKAWHDEAAQAGG